jgi:hypothetical protein
LDTDIVDDETMEAAMTHGHYQKAEIKIAKDQPTIWFDALTIEYLEELVEYDAGYIQDRMNRYMKDKRDDIDEFIEIDDMRVANADLSNILERIKALSEKDEFLCYVPAEITYEDEEDI